MGLEVPNDLKALGRLLRGERLKSWPPRGRLEWTIFTKTESGEPDYEKLLFFPLPGMKALYSALGLETPVTVLSRFPLQPKPARPLASFKSDKAVKEENEAFETFIVTLGPGCTTKGVGVGLNPQNVIDMIVPGKAAADMLQYGDRVILWNDHALTNPSTGVQEKLGSVVDSSLDTHTVVVERPLRPLSGAEKTALIMEATRRSECETDGCEAAEHAELLSALASQALAAEEAKQRMGFAREGLRAEFESAEEAKKRMGFAREEAEIFAAVESKLTGKGLKVPAPKPSLEKLVEETTKILDWM
jgi:hypothetical protein